jgi:hypothetical protein
MAFLVSPGVQVNEKDLTNVVPAVATSIGAYAGPFRWGPTGISTTISSENNLLATYGKPNTLSAQSFQIAASFLKYGNTLKVSRSISTSDAKNAVSTFLSTSGASYVTGTASLIGNTDVFSSLSTTTIGSNVTFVARYPGGLGNSLGVYVVTPTTAASDPYAKQFDYVPSYNSNNPTVVTARSTAITASGSTVLTVATSAFATIPLTTSMYVIGNNVSTSAVTISSFAVSGPNYTITVPATASAITTASTFTFFEADEIHVAVVDLDGGISGTAGTLLEKWQNLSLLTDGKRADGTNNYYRDYLYRNSAYVYANTLAIEITGADTTTTDTTYVRLPSFTTAALPHILGNTNYINGITGATGTAGADGTVGNSGDIATALNVFADAATIDINLLFCGDLTGLTSLSTAEQTVQSIANSRKDTVGFISAPVNIWQNTSNTTKLTNVLAKFNDSTATRDSYSVFDSTPLYVYNKYQDNYVWIPACGHMAGLCANTDNVADAWFSPAGYNRGNLKNVTKLAFNPDQVSRDSLYQASVNPIVSFPGQGTILFGDKTAQSKPSAFDRINVRRLFIVLEKAIATAAKYQLFELNDRFTQAMFRNMTEPFLRDIVGRRGITDFLVVCDSSNNTPEVVDTNRFVADIYIKPARSINFITLNFIATRTGVSFSEVAGA